MIDIFDGLLLFGALLFFYRLNEPKARARDLKQGPRCPYYHIPYRNK